MTLYMGLLYIVFHFLVENTGCGKNKAIPDPLSFAESVEDRVDFLYAHIRYFKGYLYHICLQDAIQSSQNVMPSLPSNVAAHATATSAPDHPVRFQRRRHEPKAEEMQRCSDENEAFMRVRSSDEDEAQVEQRNRDEDKTGVMQQYSEGEEAPVVP